MYLKLWLIEQDGSVIGFSLTPGKQVDEVVFLTYIKMAAAENGFCLIFKGQRFCLYDRHRKSCLFETDEATIQALQALTLAKPDGPNICSDFIHDKHPHFAIGNDDNGIIVTLAGMLGQGTKRLVAKRAKYNAPLR